MIVAFLKRYPIPVFAISGLLLGGIIHFGTNYPHIAEWIWFVTLILGGTPIVFQTLKGMIRGHFASDIIAMLAIITAILTKQPFAGAVVVLMQSGGEAIEAYGLRRASSSLAALLARAPRTAQRKKEDRLEEIPVEEVLVNDLLIVRPGDLVPVDGTIVEGIGEIDESALTGEPLAHSKTIGDHLFSGSVAINGILTLRANKLSSESQYAKIVMMVKKAQEEKAPIQRLADRYAIFFTPLALFMAAIGFLLTHNVVTILAVLVVATPCPLILATPLAVICGINRAADSGIIIKGGASLEQVASTNAIFFDKTGTVTYGTPFVEKVVSFTNISEEQILYYAACIEQFSTHSIATAVIKKALESHKTLQLASSFQEFPGLGVEGNIDGKHILVGSKSLLETQIGPLNNENKTSLYEGKLLIFVSIDQHYVGFIVLSDHIRQEAPSVIERLRKLGVREIMMLTGDSWKNAKAIAQQVGIEKVEAEIFPEQKADILKKYKQTYPFTAMVGDGINDAPALATATVGIAMGTYGTAISAESADIVLLVDDLSKVAEVISIGKRMLFIAKQSIFIGMGLSLVLMCIAIFGYITPPLGALLQEIIDVAVILNALRAR